MLRKLLLVLLAEINFHFGIDTRFIPTMKILYTEKFSIDRKCKNKYILKQAIKPKLPRSRELRIKKGATHV